MRTLQVIFVVVVLAACGCKTDPNQYLLERDLRLQEDRIYELESMLEEACSSREATLRENQALKKEVAGGDRGAGPDYRAPASSPSTTPPARGPRREEPKLEPPTIELPESTTTPPPEIMPGRSSAIISSGPVTELVINKRLTGGINRGQQGCSEGVMVAFEPRDAQGHTVKSPGAVSVVVLDPAAEGQAARVARWDFEPHEVPSHFRNSPFGRGLQFELPWSGEPPEHRELKLYVRYTTPEGEKITANADIRVRTADDAPAIDRKTRNAETASRPRPSRAPASRTRAQSATLGAPRDIPPISQADEAEVSEAGEESYRDEALHEQPDREERYADERFRDQRDPRDDDPRPVDEPRDVRSEDDRAYDPRPDDARPMAAPEADDGQGQLVRPERPARYERPARSESPRVEEAKRTNRPVWKPYR